MWQQVLKRLGFELSVKKEPWQIASARYFVENSEKGFTEDEFKQYIQNKYNVSARHLNQFFREEVQLPSGRDLNTAIRDGTEGWIPPLDLVSKVTDYDELKEARKNASNAWYFSIAALIVASIGVIIEFFSWSGGR